jgi:hypothetical protein
MPQAGGRGDHDSPEADPANVRSSVGGGGPLLGVGEPPPPASPRPVVRTTARIPAQGPRTAFWGRTLSRAPGGPQEHPRGS